MKRFQSTVRALMGLVVLSTASHAAFAITNEEFSSQVRALRSRMVTEPAVVGDAALLCAYLPEHRATEEPRCVALRGHLRAEMAKNKPSQAAVRKSKLDQFASCVVSIVEPQRG